MKESMVRKKQDAEPLDINNQDNGYLEEKELFLLFFLLKRKHISTMWSNLFTPAISEHIHIPDDIENKADFFEKEVQKNLEKIKSKTQSSIVLSYLLRLGKQLDKNGFLVYCNADYSLLEGGFLSEYIEDMVYEYLADTDDNRKSAAKYKAFNKKQKDFLGRIIKDEDFGRELSTRAEITKLGHLPVEAYRGAILNKKAETDFIDLVNKLITEYDGSRWDTEDSERFLEIYYRHNKEEFKKNVMSERTFLYKDYQTKLADLIFENADMNLSIKDTKKLGDYLSQYINRFISDELDGKNKHGLTQNFFSTGLIAPFYTKMFGYKKQRGVLIKHIEEKYNEYQRNDLEIGHPFIEPQYIGDDEPENVKFTISETNKDKDLFLFVHTMIALEYEKYLAIESFSYGTTDIFDLYDRGFLFRVRLLGNKKDVYESFDKKSHILDFDDTKSVLYFADREITISKRAENDAHTLLRTIFKNRNKVWNSDEVLDDWQFDTAEETPTKKVYHAGKAVNRIIAQETTIKDFLDVSTKTVAINRKYLSS